LRFGVVAPEDWPFGPSVDAAQRARLHAPVGYEEIVDRLMADLQVRRCRIEARNAPAGFLRVTLLLEGRSEDVERWYSGCGGYRAQFRLGETIGEAADQFATGQILARLDADLSSRLEKLGHTLSSAFPPALCKVWIKEGVWYRAAKAADIPDALRNAPTPTAITPARANLLRLKGAATPDQERRIVLKGPWISEGARSPNLELAKVHRSLEIHSFRFT
jgi:hypothetical protein